MALLRGLKSGLERSALEGLQVPGDTGPSAYTGSLPSTIAELNGWTLASIWDFAHNFKDITGSPNTVNAMTGSSPFQLTRLGTSQATVIAAPQSGYASQAGITIATSSQTLYKASSSWSHHATVPTVYLCTFRFESAPVTKSPQFLAGLAGDGKNGFYVQAHATSGIRVGIGNGTSGFVNTSYIGGTDFYDGEWHTLAFCIDDAAGKVKLACGAYSTESTGLTIYTPTSIFCTVGATYDGDPDWEPAVSYLLIARGQHPLAYTNFETALDAYEDARLNGTHPAAITGLPTTLAELNSVLGTITATHAWNLSSLTASPMAGSSGSAFQTFTGTMQGGVTGTAPTLSAAPQIKNAFTSQAACFMDSNGDNLWGAGNMPGSSHTAVVIFAAPVTHTGSTEYVLGKGDAAADSRWWLRSNASNQLTLDSRESAGARTTTATLTGVMTGGTWNVAAWRRGANTETNRLYVSSVASTASAAITSLPAAAGQEGGLGRPYQATLTTTTSQCKIALWAWTASSTTDANIQAAVNNLRWRYGL